MRPVASDFGLFGAGVQVHWLRQGDYASQRHVHLAAARRRPGRGRVADAHRHDRAARPARRSPSRRAPAPRRSRTPAGRHGPPVGAGGAVASPAGRYIQYRARMTSATGAATPTLHRVQVTFGAGTDRAPVPGGLAVAPIAPNTNQTRHRHAERLQRPRRRPADLPLPVVPQRHRHPGRDRGNAQPRAGRATATAATRCASRSTRPTAGARPATRSPPRSRWPTRPRRPAASRSGPTPPATNDVLRAVPSGLADVDGDQLTYRYQWLRNGSPIAGATAATLNLALAGNGDLNDRIDVDVTAVDGNGGTSPAARGAQTITGTNATPVEGTVALAPASPEDQPDADGHAERLPRAGRRAADLQVSLAAQRHGRSAAPPPPRSTSRWPATATAATPSPSRCSPPIRADARAAPAPRPDRRQHGADGRDRDRQARLARRPTTWSRPRRAGSRTPTATPSTYTYQWFRNGTAIGGATGRTLDLAEPGNGDAGDQLARRRDGARRRRRHDGGRARQPDRGQRRLARGRVLRLRGGRGHRDPRRQRRAMTARSTARPAAMPAASAARSRSTATTTSRPCPTARRSTRRTA